MQVPSPLSFYLLPAQSDNLTFIYTARDPAPPLAPPPQGSSWVSNGPCFSPGSKSRRARHGRVKHLGSGGVWEVYLSPWSSFSPGPGLCGAAGKPMSSISCVRWGGTRREEEDECAHGHACTCCYEISTRPLQNQRFIKLGKYLQTTQLVFLTDALKRETVHSDGTFAAVLGLISRLFFLSFIPCDQTGLPNQGFKGNPEYWECQTSMDVWRCVTVKPLQCYITLTQTLALVKAISMEIWESSRIQRQPGRCAGKTPGRTGTRLGTGTPALVWWPLPAG